MQIVRVWIGDPFDGGKFNGTAFFINSDTLLTAKHVVKNHLDNIFLNELKDGGVLKIDSDDITLCNRDIAIIKTKRPFDIKEANFTNTIKEGYEVTIRGFYDDTSAINNFSHTISGYQNSHYLYTLQNFISKGVSGSPVFLKSKVCGVTVARHTDKNLTYITPISDVCIEIKKDKVESKESFTSKLFKSIQREQIIILLSQEFTNITPYLREIENHAKKQFKEEFYHFELEKSYSNSKDFIEDLKESCKIEGLANRISDVKYLIEKKLIKLEKKNQKFFLLVTEFENGDTAFTKEFSSVIRDLKQHRNFFSILIGRKKLASMIYAENELSPLNNITDIFFPSDDLDNINIINRQFMQLYNIKSRVLKYLNKDSLGIALTWHPNSTINQLFWKNLIIKEDGKFIWKSKFIQELGLEIFDDE